MDTCAICHKPVVQLFETGKKGVFACFKCQPISLVPEITLGQDSSHEVIIDSSEVPNDDDSPELIQDSSTLHIGQDISLTSSGSQEENDGRELFCNICNKTFQKQMQLVNHMRNHRAERRFVCTYCNKAFSQSNNLRAHLRIHTNERPYKCTVCDKAFTQVTNLNNHMRLHTGERPFACPEPGCDKAYAQVTNLNQHMKRHQSGRPIEHYVCTVCGEQFQQRNHMYMHRREVHSDNSKSMFKARHECKTCNMVLPTAQRLMQHAAQHAKRDHQTPSSESTPTTYKCVFSSCGLILASPREHTEHLLRAHQLRVLTAEPAPPAQRRGRPPKILKTDPLDPKENITYEMQVNQLKEQSQFLPKLKVQSLF
ncbi:zinc finger protein 184 isoform X1 [Plutella xylostella]|uniref:zinc finger protein 184 isoform X1 n=1 Tax=Plutella xylostella TaxID=51655 RepID=UPI0020330249|nr:zinc finger protein 184 isoform X1 [Plutella xylostella]